jgi:hypothetical protein
LLATSRGWFASSCEHSAREGAGKVAVVALPPRVVDRTLGVALCSPRFVLCYPEAEPHACWVGLRRHAVPGREQQVVARRLHGRSGLLRSTNQSPGPRSRGLGVTGRNARDTHRPPHLARRRLRGAVRPRRIATPRRLPACRERWVQVRTLLAKARLLAAAVRRLPSALPSQRVPGRKLRPASSAGSMRSLALTTASRSASIAPRSHPEPYGAR